VGRKGPGHGKLPKPTILLDRPKSAGDDFGYLGLADRPTPAPVKDKSVAGLGAHAHLDANASMLGASLGLILRRLTGTAAPQTVNPSARRRIMAAAA
jgi:hypothetical protein